jgi:probable phosphoglycerate mutase
MRVLKKIDRISGDVVLFSSGHFLRALTAKWLNLRVQEGRLFVLTTASISILGFERTQNAIIRWNDTGEFS